MMNTANNNLTDNIFNILAKRYRYEKLVSFRKTYVLPSYESDISSIKYFIESGHKNNRFRKSYKEALSLAQDIMDYYNRECTNENIDLSSVYGQAI